MQHAETVTFGGSGLNRAAELRNSKDQLALQAQNNSKTALFWRGKPLLCKQQDGNLGLAWVDLDPPALGPQHEPLVFLGLDDIATPLFLADVSSWEPEELPDSLPLALCHIEIRCVVGCCTGGTHR